MAINNTYVENQVCFFCSKFIKNIIISNGKNNLKTTIVYCKSLYTVSKYRFRENRQSNSFSVFEKCHLAEDNVLKSNTVFTQDTQVR